LNESLKEGDWSSSKWKEWPRLKETSCRELHCCNRRQSVARSRTYTLLQVPDFEWKDQERWDRHCDILDVEGVYVSNTVSEEP
jgi:hypothetical protein